LFNDSSIRMNVSLNQTFCKDFSFHDRSRDSDLNNSNEDRLRSIYDDIDILADELIDKTLLIEKSPTALEKKSHSSSSPNLLNKSPGLDNYLIPDKTPPKEDFNKSDDDENFNIENSIQQIAEKIKLNEKNLELLDRSFNGNNLFAVFLLKNKLKAKYDCNYMITPLKQEFNNYIEKMQVQKDLNDIRKLYINYIYFPFNYKLTEFLKDN
jgi:hypothetical protein